MKQGKLEIISNRPVARDTFELRLRGDTEGVRPGQFAEVSVPGFFLRRPFSICDAVIATFFSCPKMSVNCIRDGERRAPSHVWAWKRL